MKFQFSKKFRTVYDFTQNLFFLTGLLCFSSKSLYPESITAAMNVHLTKILIKVFTWMLTVL